MAKAVGLLPNGYCLFAKVRASLPDSTVKCPLSGKGQVSAFRVARGPDVGSGATGAGPPR